MDLKTMVVSGLAAMGVLAVATAWLVKLPKKIGDDLEAWWKGYEGYCDPATQRLAHRAAFAVFEWADAELPDTLGVSKMNFIIDKLKSFPNPIGLFFRLNETRTREGLQAFYTAWKIEVEAEEAKAKEPPAA